MQHFILYTLYSNECPACQVPRAIIVPTTCYVMQLSNRPSLFGNRNCATEISSVRPGASIQYSTSVPSLLAMLNPIWKMNTPRGTVTSDIKASIPISRCTSAKPAPTMSAFRSAERA